MPLDLNNPEIIKFLTENYEKATLLRMRWNIVNADKLNLAATLPREEKGLHESDVFKAAIESGMVAVARDNKTDAGNRRRKPIRDAIHVPGIADIRKGHSIVEMGLGDPKTDPRLARPDTDLTTDPIMRPVDLKQKKILFKDRPRYGREVYLKKRSKALVPEDKYYFAESSAWIYGWRLKDSYFGKHGPKYGRVWHLAREASRSGPEPDPRHYKNAGHQEIKCSITG